MLPPTGRRMADAGLRFQQICNQLPSCRRQSVLPPCGHKHPSQAGRACSWMIWPSGGALSVAVVLRQALRFSRFAISLALCYRVLVICCQPPASSASGSRNHRAALYCRQSFLIAAVRKSASEVPLRACNSKRNFKDAQPPFHSGWRLRWFDCSAISLTLRRTADAVSDAAHRCPSLRSGHRPLTAADG